MDESRLREQLCNASRRLEQRGFFAATEGNLSVRLRFGRFLCTPAGAEKGHLEPQDLVIIDQNAQSIGPGRPSTEIKMHLALYRANPQTHAVVHCHAPHATAMAISAAPLRSGVLAEVEACLGDVPKIPYRMPGSDALATAVGTWATRARCAIMCNHGAVSWAPDLTRARHYMEILDTYCRAVLLAQPLGDLASLTPSQVGALRSAGGVG
jgi:L-fuculose-phosphate aldolase